MNFDLLLCLKCSLPQKPICLVYPIHFPAIGSLNEVSGMCGQGSTYCPPVSLESLGGNVHKSQEGSCGEDSRGLGVEPCWMQTEWHVLCPLVFDTNGLHQYGARDKLSQ
jgi:hypothetical protein